MRKSTPPTTVDKRAASRSGASQLLSKKPVLPRPQPLIDDRECSAGMGFIPGERYRRDNQIRGARVLEVRIHLSPAVSQQTFGSSKRRRPLFDRTIALPSTCSHGKTCPIVLNNAAADSLTEALANDRPILASRTCAGRRACARNPRRGSTGPARGRTCQTNRCRWRSLC